MNTINRVVLVILLLALMVLLTMALVLPHVVLTGVGELMVQWGEFFGTMTPQWLRWVGGVLLAIVLDAILAFLIFLEVRRTRKQYIRVQQVTGGMATISTESIVQQLQHSLEPLEHVTKVTPTINAKRDKVQAIVDVEVRAGTNVPVMATQLMGMVQRVLTESLGLQVFGQPEVRIKVLPGPLPPLDQPIIPPPEPEPKHGPPPVPVEKPEAWAGPPPLDAAPEWPDAPQPKTDEELPA